jgi:hypothetical protein
MSCEDELANLMNAQENLRYQKTECDNIAISQGTDSPAYLQCRGLLGGAEGALDRAYEAYATCVAKAKAARLLYSTGHVLLLRVAEPSHNAWGGGETNKIRAEVVFKLDSLPVKSFGFPLTNDASGPARQGMLDLLREAFVHNLRVRVEYDELVQPPNQNSMAFRVWLVREPPGPPSLDVVPA